MKQLQRLGIFALFFGMSASLLGCEPSPVVAGGRQTCATKDGRVRCWGNGQHGVLGYANTDNIGDNETPATAGDVFVGGDVSQLALGFYHSCALITGGAVRCWGRNSLGQLGYGNTQTIGDDETPASVGSVNVGGSVRKIAAGGFHTCALLTSGDVRCWGLGSSGQLGYANTQTIGDNEHPFTAGSVNVGGEVRMLAAGESHTCAIMQGTDKVRCWGLGSSGQLGYGNTNNIGDNEAPSSAGSVSLGVGASVISAGGPSTCALGADLQVRCWGSALFGQLGYGDLQSIGDNETPASKGPVDLGARAVAVSVGHGHTCAVLEGSGDRVRCWGNGFGGKLGLVSTAHVGDNEVPASQPPISIE